jgi:hypothetical protein
MPLVATTTNKIKNRSILIAARAVLVGLWQKTKKSGTSIISSRLSSSVAANKKDINQEKKKEEEEEVTEGVWKQVTRRMIETKIGIWRRLRDKI